MKITFLTILITIQIFQVVTFAKSNQNAAKVLITRGKVFIKFSGKIKKLQKGSNVPVGSVIKTSKRSFAKLIFIDKSTINIGPNSLMKIETFPKNKPGIIGLLRGKIRSKVSKNYMDIESGKSKLFIRTKTAAMGVRGTDFNVIYNPTTKNTTLLTFSGAVAMAKISHFNKKFNQKTLERLVSSSKAVIVHRGEFSAANLKHSKVSTPIKISPSQLQLLKKNDLSQTKSSKEIESKHKSNSKLESNPKKLTEGKREKSQERNTEQKQVKVIRNLAPPGLEARSNIVGSQSLDQTLKTTVGFKKFNKVKKAIKIKKIVRAEISQSNNRAGGILDINTGTYIAPPIGSTFDPNQGVYKINSNIATFDKKGLFTSKLITINNAGKVTLKPVMIISNQKRSKKRNNQKMMRMPASQIAINPANMNTVALSEVVTSTNAAAGIPAINIGTQVTTTQQNMADKIINTTVQSTNTFQNNTALINSRTNVNFIFNAN